MKTRVVFHGIFYMLMLYLVFLPQSCKEPEEYIPYVRVQFSVNLNQFNDLATTGFSMKYPGGYAGVVIYCSYYDVTEPSNSFYYAYDATCTLEVTDSCSLTNESNGLLAKCPCCESEYTLLDGQPIKGDAHIPLKQYNATVVGNILYVSN